MLKELTKASPPLSYFNILWCRWRTCWESKCLTRRELFACSWKSTQKNTAGIAFSLIVNVTLASISNISALIHPASYKTHNTVMVLKTNVSWGGKKHLWARKISVISAVCCLFSSVRKHLRSEKPINNAHAPYIVAQFVLLSFSNSLLDGICMPSPEPNGSYYSLPARDPTPHWL